MPRRRRSPLRTLLGLLMVAGLGVAVAAGVIAIRDYVNEPPIVLSTDSAVDANPPDPLDASRMERVAPVAIRYDELRIDDEIISVGLDDDGELEVPDETEVGWWKFGSAPGLPGATVMAAHVSWNHTAGPFHQLGNAEIGDRLEVDSGDGYTRTYQIVERTMYGKSELPAERIWRTTGPETLVLITCGGDFNPNIGRYRHNIVVYAIPVAERLTDDPSDVTLDDDEEDDDDVSASGSSGTAPA
ncbi:MAG: class F sortase [Ilumatobacter sp.]|nr:class F sortase [Ilumatobacter sp.]